MVISSMSGKGAAHMQGGYKPIHEPGNSQDSVSHVSWKSSMPQSGGKALRREGV